MLSPFFGLLEKSPCLNISGRSDNNGFSLTIINKLGKRFVVNPDSNPPRYNPDNPVFTSVIISFFVMACVIFSGAPIVLSFFAPPYAAYDSWIQVLGIFTAMSILGLVWTALTLRKAEPHYVQWHALEHKCVVLLQERLEPTAENLTRCPKTLIFCGTGWLMLLWELVSASFLYLVLIKSFSIAPLSLHLHIFVLLFWGITALLLIERTVISSRLTRKAFRLCFPVFIPAILLPACIEWLLVLKEPSQDKIAYTVETLRNFLKANPNLQATP